MEEKWIRIFLHRQLQTAINIWPYTGYTWSLGQNKQKVGPYVRYERKFHDRQE